MGFQVSFKCVESMESMALADLFGPWSPKKMDTLIIFPTFDGALLTLPKIFKGEETLYSSSRETCPIWTDPSPLINRCVKFYVDSTMSINSYFCSLFSALLLLNTCFCGTICALLGICCHRMSTQAATHTQVCVNDGVTMIIANAGCATTLILPLCLLYPTIVDDRFYPKQLDENTSKKVYSSCQTWPKQNRFQKKIMVSSSNVIFGHPTKKRTCRNLVIDQSPGTLLFTSM